MLNRILLLFILTSVAAIAGDLRYFNPGTLGKPTDESTALVLPGEPEAVYPSSISTDIKEGRYFSVTVNYPEDVSFEAIREALNKRYKEYENESYAGDSHIGLWRNEDDGYGIQLKKSDNTVRVTYISFMDNSETWDRLEELQTLSSLWKNGSTPGVQLPADDKEKLETLIFTILPDQEYIGEDREWQVKYLDDGDEEGDVKDILSVRLLEKGDVSANRLIWFHIFYTHDKQEFYGNENFEGYRGMGMEDRHYFILVGNVEIRAVAASEEYKNDVKIKDILKAFKLKDIEKL
ncbi:MAG: hypothetical protein K9N48_01705 [Verrucomicrobia bacterium]|nr:hypothetical protein [Verrucomicrobiota bacterium]MCF7707590.1 hypothetical protein [Verrucomicrobiota bacterium]